MSSSDEGLTVREGVDDEGATEAGRAGLIGAPPAGRPASDTAPAPPQDTGEGSDQGQTIASGDG